MMNFSIIYGSDQKYLTANCKSSALDVVKTRRIAFLVDCISGN